MADQFIQIVPGLLNTGPGLLVQFQDGTPIPFSRMDLSEGTDQITAVTITLLVDGDTVRLCGGGGQ